MGGGGEFENEHVGPCGGGRGQAIRGIAGDEKQRSNEPDPVEEGQVEASTLAGGRRLDQTSALGTSPRARLGFLLRPRQSGFSTLTGPGS